MGIRVVDELSQFVRRDQTTTQANDDDFGGELFCSKKPASF